jgi:hypothetical protein
VYGKKSLSAEKGLFSENRYTQSRELKVASKEIKAESKNRR